MSPRCLLLCLMLAVSAAPSAVLPHAQSVPAHHFTVGVEPPAEERVDINHAGVAELLQVPNMTRGWAERVVRFRPYRTKQDLLDNGVLAQPVYERVKVYIIAHH